MLIIFSLRYELKEFPIPKFLTYFTITLLAVFYFYGVHAQTYGIGLRTQNEIQGG